MMMIGASTAMVSVTRAREVYLSDESPPAFGVTLMDIFQQRCIPA